MVITVKALNLEDTLQPQVLSRALAAVISAITGRDCNIEIVARDDEFGIDISRIVR